MGWKSLFLSKVSSFTHPTKARVRRLIPGFSSGQVLVSVQGNNEVGCWNLESGGRHQVLWASLVPPLSSSPSSQHSVCAMRMSGNCLITGRKNHLRKGIDKLTKWGIILVIICSKLQVVPTVSYDTGTWTLQRNPLSLARKEVTHTGKVLRMDEGHLFSGEFSTIISEGYIERLGSKHNDYR